MLLRGTKAMLNYAKVPKQSSVNYNEYFREAMFFMPCKDMN